MATADLTPAPAALPPSGPPSSGPPSEPSGRPRWWRRRRLQWLLLLALPGAALLGQLLLTASGAAWLLRQIPGVEIRHQKLQGNLWRGLDIEALDIRAVDPALGFTRIQAAHWHHRWRPDAFLFGQIDVRELHLRGLQIALPPTPEPTAAPTLPRLHLPVSIQVQSLRSDDARLLTGGAAQPLPDLDTTLLLYGSTVQLRDLHLQWQEQTYTLQLQARLADTLSAQLDLSSHGLSLKGSCQQQPDIHCSGSLNWQNFSHPLTHFLQLPLGAFDVRWSDNRLHMTGSGELGLSGPELPLQFRPELDISLSPATRTLEIHSLKTPYLDGTLSASGTLNWQEALTLDATINAEGLDVGRWLAARAAARAAAGATAGTTATAAEAQPLTTSFSAHLNYQSLPDDYRLQIHSDAWQVDMGAGPILAALQLELSRHQLQLHQLELRQRQNRVQVQGTTGFGSTAPVDLKASLDLPDLSQVAARVGGSLQGRIELQGNLPAPETRLDLLGSELVWGAYKVKSLDTRIALLPPPWQRGQSLAERLQQTHLRTFTLNAGGLRVNTLRIGDLALQGQGTLREHSLNLSAGTIRTGGDDPLRLNISRFTLNGGIDSSGGPDLPGWLQQSRWRLNLSALTLGEPGAQQTWALQQPVAIQLGASASGIAPLCLAYRADAASPSTAQDPAQLCLDKAEYTESGRFALQSRLHNVQLGTYYPLLSRYLPNPPPPLQASGTLSAHADISGRRQAGQPLQLTLDSELNLSDGLLQYPRTKDAMETMPIRRLSLSARGDQQRLELNGVLGLDQEQNLLLSGGLTQLLTPQQRLQLQLRGGSGRLDYVQGLIAGVQEVSGELQLDIQLEQVGAAQPRLSGSAALVNGGLLLPQTGTRFSQFNARVEASEQRLQLQGSGLVGDQPASFSGELVAAPEPGTPLRLDLRLSGRELLLLDLPDQTLRASPDLTLSGRPGTWHLGGAVRIDKTRLVLRDIPAGAVRVSDDARIYGRDVVNREPPSRLSVDLTVSLGDAVSFSSMGLESLLGGSLHLTRKPKGKPRAQGVLLLTKGTYKKYGQNLAISDGRLLFSGPLDNPGLDISASRTIEDITVGLQLSGTARRPLTRLYANPAMEESDILAYLITGKPLSQAGSGDTNQLQTAALNMGLKQALPTLKAITSKFGIDELNIEESLSGDSLVSAGKRFGERLELKYVYGLLEAAGSVVINYKLTKHLRVETASGEAQSADLIYSWDSAKPLPSGAAGIRAAGADAAPAAR